jgi:hypothetical protein
MAVSSIAKIIAKNLAKKKQLQSASKKITSKDVKEVYSEAKKNPGGPRKVPTLSKPRSPRTGPVIRKTSTGGIKVTTLGGRKGKKPDTSIKKSYQSTRVTPEDVVRKRIQEKNARVRNLLTPIKPRGTRSGGKSIQGAKPNPRTITIGKPSPARERNKLVSPGDRKMDESRKLGISNAYSSSRFNQPTISSRTRPKVEREEQRLSKADYESQRIADERVKQALKDIKKAEKKKALEKRPKKGK